VLAFDNVSGLPGWLSDALCRLSTGGGWACRQLYTDNDEVLFDGTRPAVLNGIEHFISPRSGRPGPVSDPDRDPRGAPYA
jgi:hypothetical protein